MLKKLGIVIGNDTKAATLFENAIPNFLAIKYKSPSDYINICLKSCKSYLDESKSNNLNGKIFEYIVSTLCVRESILPLYLSAKVAFVPNVTYDLMLYSQERGPICLSLKTSLRERYKQADLEAIALKYVHRKSLSYLITLNHSEAKKAKEKILTGDIIGLDQIIVASDPEFNVLIDDLLKFKFVRPPTVEVVTSNQIVTAENVKRLVEKNA